MWEGAMQTAVRHGTARNWPSVWKARLSMQHAATLEAGAGRGPPKSGARPVFCVLDAGHENGRPDPRTARQGDCWRRAPARHDERPPTVGVSLGTRHAWLTIHAQSRVDEPMAGGVDSQVDSQWARVAGLHGGLRNPGCYAIRAYLHTTARKSYSMPATLSAGESRPDECPGRLSPIRAGRTQPRSAVARNGESST